MSTLAGQGDGTAPSLPRSHAPRFIRLMRRGRKRGCHADSSDADRRRIRRVTINPIIIVSARSDDMDKIEALDHGAYDYVTKPFNVDELMARVRAAARRVAFYSGKTDTATVFENGGLRIHYDSMEVTVRGEVVHLTPIEYRILKLLAQNTGWVMTHSMTIRDVWGVMDSKNVPSLRVFMTTLRKKLEQNSGGEQYIQTRIGVGYRMAPMESR